MKQLAVFFVMTCISISIIAQQQAKYLHARQQDFVNLKFGMFIHYSIATYLNHDWADPDASPSIFSPAKLDCNQWAEAATSAKMTFGCFTAKHVSGFAMWDTKTTDYNVMNSPAKRDLVNEFVKAFRAKNMKVMLYYSIMDTHHKLRPNSITREHIELVKEQLTELLKNYGEIFAIFFDAWDAPWARISYSDVPFDEIYSLVKSLQPNCLVMDLNASKYPADGLFYTDIKSYEQNAGEHIAREKNTLPAVSSYPINDRWFWKTNFPRDPVKNAEELVNQHLVPLNNAFCTFILNVAPNRDGLLDFNTVAGLKKIGQLWTRNQEKISLPLTELPIVSVNLALRQESNSTWSDDMWISDFANDDNFNTAWVSNPVIKEPYYEIVFDRYRHFNSIVIVEDSANVKKYTLQYFSGGKWKTIISENKTGRIKMHRFEDTWAGRVRVLFHEYTYPPRIMEIGIYMGVKL